jgi:hypothetical protein
VTEDLTEVLVIQATDNFSGFFAGVPKTGAVETIPHESFLNPLKRSRVARRGFGQGAMKGRVKTAKWGTLLPRISRQAVMPVRL